MIIIRLRAVIIGLAFVIICGCAPAKNPYYPKATEGFQSKGFVEETCKKTFTKIKEILADNKISIDQSNDTEYKIGTGYLEGDTVMDNRKVIYHRYKYNISLSEEKDNRCKINIAAIIESSSKSATWHDTSDYNPALVKQLEQWLYEKIEK